MNVFKVVLVGNACSGKSTLIKKVLGFPCDSEYVATVGCEIHPITFFTDDGTYIQMEVWDCAGDIRFLGMGDGYTIGADVVIRVGGDGTYPIDPEKYNGFIYEVDEISLEDGVNFFSRALTLAGKI